MKITKVLLYATPIIVYLVVFGALVTFYGLFFLASFGTNYKVKDLKYENISILLPAKDERILLERTLNSIVNSNYPHDN
ncbi:MAG: hypothetical protein ACTSPQ_12630 [Candidatus Helarchaeota archaeon]